MTVIHHHYRPRGSAVELFHRRDPEVLMSGPAGTGKSRACLEKLHIMCLVNPGMTALIVRKTLVSLGSTALKTFREIVAKEALDAGLVEFYGGSPEKPPQYRYDNGSSIVIGGMDKPSKVMSSEYDLVYVQEAIELTITDWEALTSRLRNWRVSFQQIIADTNPAMPTHWLKARCDSGSTVMLESRHEENPQLFDDDGNITDRGTEYMDRLDRLTGVRYLRLRRGLWVAAEGLVYETWDPAIHLVDQFRHPIGLDALVVGRLWVFESIRTAALGRGQRRPTLSLRRAVPDETSGRGPRTRCAGAGGSGRDVDRAEAPGHRVRPRCGGPGDAGATPRPEHGARPQDGERRHPGGAVPDPACGGWQASAVHPARCLRVPGSRVGRGEAAGVHRRGDPGLCLVRRQEEGTARQGKRPRLSYSGDAHRHAEWSAADRILEGG